MIIDPADLDTNSVYKLLVGAVVPRPIAWVSTRNRDGVLNLAPFSFFTVASREPPMLAISIGPRTGGEDYPKDTLTNLRESQDQHGMYSRTFTTTGQRLPGNWSHASLSR